MSIFAKISDMILPAILFYIVGYGLISKISVYEHFIKGAAEGIKTVIHMLPTLIGLMVAVGILRNSGFLELLANVLQAPASFIHMPKEVVPLAIVKLFSGSAATGVLLDLFKTYGPDSYIGTVASLMMSSTETVFYTMSVYFLAAKVTKTRYTLAGALFATFCGIAASVWLAAFC